MNNKTKSALILAALTFSLTAGVIGLGASIVSTVAAYVIDENSYFTYTDPYGQIFKCYSITGESTKVAIAWGMDPSAAPQNLEVPGTVTHGGNTYTVSAVAKAGFRYCDFETVSLPHSINEIGEEAFGYCENMTRFTLPYNVTEIAPSTFIDCRAMQYFFYSNSDGSSFLLTNDKVTTIGDHAFTSCVSLMNFNCSTVLTHFGYSCFQNCQTLSNFYFPSKTGTGNNVNKITVEKYAFANCTNLKWVYFEENLDDVEPYAFVDCDSALTLHFGYNTLPFTPDNKYETNWRKKLINNNDVNKIPIENDHIVILQSNEYPGLRYTIESANIMLDCQNQDSENLSQKTIKLADGGAGNEYAAIYKWDPPTEIVQDYYNPTTKALTIPGSVRFDGHDYPLKVIKKETFANMGEYIRSVTFSDGLVQICRRAFFKCSDIENLDFSECTTLKEISNGIFADRSTENIKMENITTLALPNSLEYLGKYAFFNFLEVRNLSFKANDPDEPSQLKVLGGYCFSNIGGNIGAAEIDVALPCSLSDAAAIEANINKEESTNYNTSNWAAVGPYAFGSRTGNKNDVATNRTAVRVVTMDEPTSAQLADNTYTCSISPNAFNRSWFMTKFVASKNLCLVGCDSFKNCEQLREIFLTTQKAAAFVTRTGNQYPWGAFKTTDSSLAGSQPETSILGASSTVKRDLVIYVDGPAPGLIENATYSSNQVNGVDVQKWNTDTTSATTSYNVSAGLALTQTRTGIPTFYNVDFSKTIYWKPKAKVNNAQRAASFLDDDSLPAYVNDYNDGVIVFVEQSGKYTVSKYYCDNSHQPYNNEVDLTNVTFDNFTQDANDDINISANLTKIGMCSFATSSGANQVPGLYFKLPSTIQEIGERAFFRHGNGANDVLNKGVRVVTYVSGNTPQVPTGVSYGTGLKPGYCMLPNGVTSIGLDAFYNNYFKSVTLGSSITHFGAGAFYTGAKLEKVNNVDGQPTATRAAIETFTMTTNSNFQTINNGVYYIGDASKKTLLYQAQAVTGALSIASGTKAIAMYACSNTSYTSIELNSELTHIYGMAFQNNLALTTVTGGANVKYISAMASDEIWDSSLPFENIDYAMRMNDHIRQINSRSSAFRSCRNLVTMDFRTMTKLVKIGSSAFRDCVNLEEMTGNTNYSYYLYDGSGESLIETTHSGILDLSGCQDLRVIHGGAFVNCPKIKYLHLPNTNGQIYISQTKENLGSDQTVTNTNAIINDKNNTRVLIGDKINKAGRGFDTTFSGVSSHYHDAAFGAQSNLISTVANHNTVYYYAASVADIIGGGTTGLTSGDQKANYWTIKNGSYILIEGTYTETNAQGTFTYSNAKKYFQANP